MKRDQAYLGQEVTWVKQSPWPPLHCKIEVLYGREARVVYKDWRFMLQHKYAPISKLLPGHIGELNDIELKKLLNPRYKRQRKADYEERECW